MKIFGTKWREERYQPSHISRLTACYGFVPAFQYLPKDISPLGW